MAGKENTTNFLSCDWGTSTFRLRLVNADTLKIIAETTTDKGIAATYAEFKNSGKAEEDRIQFYLQILQQQIMLLAEKGKMEIRHIPLLLSGMASSSIGLKELPYKTLPFSISGSDLIMEKIEPSTTFSNSVYLISGVQSANDVMRGEETKLVGCASDTENAMYLLPGTHCKHVTVQQGKVSSFCTYMTGEFFEWLSVKSILANSVEKDGGLEISANKIAFVQGVQQSSKENLLHNSFLVRTRNLLNDISKTENYFFLSGLVIGTEIQSLVQQKVDSVILVSKAALKPLYMTALEAEGIQVTKTIDGDAALIKGQAKLLNHLVNF